MLPRVWWWCRRRKDVSKQYDDKKGRRGRTHLAREEPEQTPCEVERFKDGPVLVDPLLDKLVLEPAEELECELYKGVRA